MAAASANLSAGNLDHAESLATEALAQAEELGDRYRASELRNNLCYGSLLRGDYESARAIAETGLTEARHAENHVIVASLYPTSSSQPSSPAPSPTRWSFSARDSR